MPARPARTSLPRMISQGSDMLFIRYLSAIPRLKGRPRLDPHFRLGVITTIKVSIAMAFMTFWVIRVPRLPHDTFTLINFLFLFAIVTTLFFIAWGAFLRMLVLELRPLVHLGGKK